MATAPAAPGAVLIGDRFVVRGAIRHSFRGGVFRVTDRQTGAAVVLKQARPHVMSSHIGTDARDLLRHEGQVLDALGPTGVVPAMVALVLHQENLFLAQEEVPGVTLLDWVTVRAAEEWHGNGAPLADALDQVGQLVDLVAAVHDQGWVLRDLKPNNVMVTPDRRLRLIDLETAVRSGRPALPVGTAGYLPPELARVLPNPELRDGVAMAADWIDRRLFDVPRILPGLYQGRSGVAWALHDAARLLHDDAVALRAIAHATQIPLLWPIPDVFHGAAGSGLAQLHLWTSTGDPELKRRSGSVADGLMRAARRHDGRLVWPMPDRASFDSPGAGGTYYGFAHGAAGIGAFLLYSALATGRQDHLDAARDVGATLEAVADLDATAAFWPAEEGEGPVRRRHWCHGSSGVGTFLIRLWLATGEPRFRELAEAAATACYRARWQSLNAACHGLAGDGEFLLDPAEFTGEQRYREWAWEFATILHARHAIRDGLLLPADNSAGGRITADYGNGLTGVIGFLLRLRHGGHRAWMPDQLLHPPTSDHAVKQER